MERTAASEEAISPELVLVDAELAARARQALPDPPWLHPAVAEALQRVEASPTVAVEERPALEEAPPRPEQPSFSSHLRTTAVFGFSLVALVTVVSLALEFVPRSAKPTLATVRAEPAVPAPAKTSTTKQAAKRPKVKPKPARKAKPKPAPTRRAKRSTPPGSAPKHATKPKARAAVRVERVLSWPAYHGAAYYEVYLRRGATTVFEVRTSKRTAAIRLKLKPGRYHAFVRPAIPTDAGITLGPAIVDKIVSV